MTSKVICESKVTVNNEDHRRSQMSKRSEEDAMTVGKMHTDGAVWALQLHVRVLSVTSAAQCRLVLNPPLAELLCLELDLQ